MGFCQFLNIAYARSCQEGVKKVRVLFCKSAHGTALVTAVPIGDKCYFSFPRRFILLVFLFMYNFIMCSNNSSLPVGTLGNPSDALRSGCGKPVGRTVGRLWESPLLTRRAKAIKWILNDEGRTDFSISFP